MIWKKLKKFKKSVDKAKTMWYNKSRPLREGKKKQEKTWKKDAAWKENSVEKKKVLVNNNEKQEQAKKLEHEL